MCFTPFIDGEVAERDGIGLDGQHVAVGLRGRPLGDGDAEADGLRFLLLSIARDGDVELQLLAALRDEQQGAEEVGFRGLGIDGLAARQLERGVCSSDRSFEPRPASSAERPLDIYTIECSTVDGGADTLLGLYDDRHFAELVLELHRYGRRAIAVTLCRRRHQVHGIRFRFRAVEIGDGNNSLVSTFTDICRIHPVEVILHARYPVLGAGVAPAISAFCHGYTVEHVFVGAFVGVSIPAPYLEAVGHVIGVVHRRARLRRGREGDGAGVRVGVAAEGVGARGGREEKQEGRGPE